VLVYFCQKARILIAALAPFCLDLCKTYAYTLSRLFIIPFKNANKSARRCATKTA
jgi:hypothetical protein